MFTLPKLEELDRDGAIPTPATHAAFLRKAGVGAGDILDYALTLEYLEAAFYNEAVKGGKLEGHAEVREDRRRARELLVRGDGVCRSPARLRAVTTLLEMAPLIVLFESSIWLAVVFERRWNLARAPAAVTASS
jgi:hypothetical protein